MEILVIWFALTVVVGFLAHSRGRSSFLWIALSILTSPLVGGVLLFIMDDKSGAQKAARSKALEVDASAFILQMEILKARLNQNEIAYLDFQINKDALIESLKGKSFPDGIEHFLTQLKPLMDNETLTEEDLIAIRDSESK